MIDFNGDGKFDATDLFFMNMIFEDDEKDADEQYESVDIDIEIGYFTDVDDDADNY